MGCNCRKNKKIIQAPPPPPPGMEPVTGGQAPIPRAMTADGRATSPPR